MNEMTELFMADARPTLVIFPGAEIHRDYLDQR